MKQSDARGSAIALEWTDSGGAGMWMNRLHDDTVSNAWTGWTRVTTGVEFSLSGSTLTITKS